MIIYNIRKCGGDDAELRRSTKRTIWLEGWMGTASEGGIKLCIGDGSAVRRFAFNVAELESAQGLAAFGHAVLHTIVPQPTVSAHDLDWWAPHPLAGDGWAGPWRVLPADRWPREATWWWTATTTHEGASCS